MAPYALLAQIKPYVSKENNFNIHFPNQPIVEKDTVNTEIGILDIHFYTAEHQDNFFMLSINDYPDGFFDFGDDAITAGILEETANTVGEGFSLDSGDKFTMESSEAFVYDKEFQGRTFRGKVANLYIIGRYIMIENKLFQMLVLSQGAYLDNEKTDAYFNSFKFIK